jgi:hypothetical protein
VCQIESSPETVKIRVHRLALEFVVEASESMKQLSLPLPMRRLDHST